MTFSQLYMEPVRTILSNEINDVVIYRSLKWEGTFFTVVFIKERKTIEKVLELLSDSHSIGSKDGDLLSVYTLKDTLVLAFRYFQERIYSSYASIVMMETQSVFYAAKSFIERCMGSELPIELLWMTIQDENISIDKQNNVYFNYYLNFKKLPETMDKQQLVDKASYFVKRMFTQYYQKKAKRGKIKFPKAVELFVRKQEKGSFSSLADVYEDILFIIKDEQEKQKGLRGLWEKFKAKTGINDDVIKISIVIAVIAITVVYVYSESKSRGIPAFLYQQNEDVSGIYDGVNTIGTEDLTDGRV